MSRVPFRLAPSRVTSRATSRVPSLVVGLIVGAVALGSLGCQSPILGASCRIGLTECGGVCVDLMSDPASCGACGVQCADDQACRVGACVDPWADAGPDAGARLDGSIDGSLDAGPPRDAGPADAGPRRDAGPPADGGPPPGCDLGELRCGLECVRPGSDPSNCGGCGRACGVGEVCAEGACSARCEAPLGVCDALCVNLTNHPDNCGVCGESCPSGVCTSGVCSGPTAGHVVVIGHSYEESRPLMNRVAGNAVFLARTNPTRVVVFEGYATAAAVVGTDAAIAQVAAETGRSWTRMAAEEDTVPLALASADVLVVYAQALADDEQIVELGEAWATALGTFLSTGGVLVVLDGAGRNGGTHRLLEPTGLMTSTGTREVTGTLVDVVNPADAVALGVPLRYRAERSSVRLGTADGSPVVWAGSGPVVVHRVVTP